MDKQRIFNAIIVDTNAFDGKGNDFCGYHSKLLPSFFDTIRRLNIQLISHPILKEETIKHIKTGDWKNKPENAITAITKYKRYLEIAGVSYDAIIEKLKDIDLCKNTIDAFQKEISSALMLSYSDPEKVFKKYFSNEPPFSESGAKKSEFPDAFVIEAIKQYLIDNPTISVLIVAKDKDWKNAFEDNKNI